MVCLDGGTGVGDGACLEGIGFGGVFAEVTDVVSLAVGEDYWRCLRFLQEGIEDFRLVAIELGK